MLSPCECCNWQLFRCLHLSRATVAINHSQYSQWVATTYVQGDPDPGSMSAAVSNMMKALVQAGQAVLHDDRFFDQASFAQLMSLFRVRF